MSKPIVLITGGTGLTGSHIIAQLLEQGQYQVRGVARSASKLKNIFPNAGPSLEIVERPTLTSDYTDALKGVYAVIHVASATFANGATTDEIFEAAFQGAVHLIQQAVDQGVKKIVYTGTYGSLLDSELTKAFQTEIPLTEKDIGKVTVDTLNRNETDLTMMYQACKTAAEKKIWDIAHANPDVDMTVILPPAIFGPLVPNFPVKSRDSLSSNDFVYELVMNGPDTWPANPMADLVDVRDIARAHVVALSLGPLSTKKDKRFIVSCSKYWWKDVADLIRRARPHLAHRLPRKDLPAPMQILVPLDLTFTEKYLPGYGGMHSYYPWEESVLAALDSAMVLEKPRSKL
ncbi:hypothetical protein VKT23_013463 [Stygiomarasmius scandens]|uniref:NAD-dependent epimerase/dehydratase domain-containing protein n=1 Tax=Marasmiellus scandens TaxID=2682957 RepID=A0ABR1J425_9AGAR